MYEKSLLGFALYRLGIVYRLVVAHLKTGNRLGIFLFDWFELTEHIDW